MATVEARATKRQLLDYLDAVRELRQRGAIVDRAVCVIDRESSGASNLAEIGVALTALFTMTQLKAAAGG